MRPLRSVFGRTVIAFLIMSSATVYGQYYAVNRFSAGLRPLGVATLQVSFPSGSRYVAAANSGDNTVSLFRLTFDQNHGFLLLPPSDPSMPASPIPASYQVPMPYGVVPCGAGFLVTSSAGDSVTWLKLTVYLYTAVGAELRTIRVGPLPYSAACYTEVNSSGSAGLKAAVSTFGDNALSVVDLNSGTVTSRVPNVPGSRALRGIAVDGNQVAWVAGTDGNVVTLVNLAAAKVLASLPVLRPIAVHNYGNAVSVASGNTSTVTLFDYRNLQVVSTFGVAANPQDVDLPFSTSGNSVFQAVSDNSGRIVGSTLIADLPGALGVSVISTQSTPAAVATSRDTNAIYAITRVQLPQPFGISNGASFAASAGVAPGSLASTFADTRLGQAQPAATLPLPTNLAGVSLRVGGTISYTADSGFVYSPSGSVLAPLLYVDPRQINFQVPHGIIGDNVPIQLQRADGSSLLATVRILDSVPGIFTVLPSGSGPGAVLNQNYSLNLPTNPASRGSVIQIFATGAGATNPTVAAGAAANSNPLALTIAQPTVSIGGKTAQVQFSGLAPGFAGLWQINAVVPADVTLGNAVSLSMTVGGQTSNIVTIAVQ